MNGWRAWSRCFCRVLPQDTAPSSVIVPEGESFPKRPAPSEKRSFPEWRALPEKGVTKGDGKGITSRFFLKSRTVGDRIPDVEPVKRPFDGFLTTCFCITIPLNRRKGNSIFKISGKCPWFILGFLVIIRCSLIRIFLSLKRLLKERPIILNKVDQEYGNEVNIIMSGV